MRRFLPLALLLAGGCEEETSRAAARLDPPEGGARLDSARSWTLTTRPGSVLNPTVSERLSQSTILIVDERIPHSAWQEQHVKDPSGRDLTYWKATPRASIALSKAEDPEHAIRLTHSQYPVQPAGLGLSVDAFRYLALPNEVFLALPRSVPHPGGEFRLTYAATPPSALGPLEHLLSEPSDHPAWESVTLRHDTRPSVILPPPAAISRAVSLPRQPILQFGYALLQWGWQPRGKGLQHADSQSDGVGFRVRLATDSGREETIWERYVSPAEANQFLDARIPLESWDGEQATITISTFGSRADPASEENLKDDFAFVASPSLYSAATPRTPPRNVVLILIDTLRADALGCLGNPRPVSPNLDALARSGTLFTRARSSSPWTLPSHASLFTALFPTQHGLLDTTRRLDSQHVTLAEVLQRGGWRTAAFTDSVFVSPDYGLEQGFDRFDDRAGGIAPVVERAREWISSGPEPFFTFIHTYQVHGPYDPPEPYRSRLVTEYTGDLPQAVDPGDLHGRFAGPRKKLPAAGLRYARELYEAELAYTDHVLGAFFDWLRVSGRWDRTLLIVTSDHGEEFAEHGGFGHPSQLYEELLRVPLIVRFPDKADDAGRRIDVPVRLIDIAPTVAEWTDRPVPPRWTGVSLRDMGAERAYLATVVAAESRAAFAILQDSWKWIHAPKGFYPLHPERASELFDLRTDPREQESLRAPARDADFAKRKARYLRKYSRLQDAPGDPVQLSPEQLQRLRAMGYLK